MPSAEASGRDLSQFMAWYAQAGTPTLVCKMKYDAGRRTADLTVEQVLAPTPGQPTKKPLQIPLRVGLLGGNGNDLPLTLADGRTLDDGILEITKKKETFRFVDVPGRPVPSLLREFSAPATLEVDLADADLLFLMQHDRDAFNRWQASQDLAMRLLMAMVAALRAKGRRPTPGRSSRRSARSSPTMHSSPPIALRSSRFRAKGMSPA